MIGGPLIVLSPETTTLAPSQLLWPPGGRSSPPMGRPGLFKRQNSHPFSSSVAPFGFVQLAPYREGVQVSGSVE